MVHPKRQAGFSYLRPEDIKRLETFEFAPKAVVDGYFAGRHTSRRSGSSQEFRDYRQYVPGDDPALIDWRVYARSDRYFLKTFEQETNMDGHILLDSSASMGFGDPLSKLEYASFFCAALTWLILRCTDRVSLQLFDDHIRQFHPPGSTRRHLHHMLKTLEENRPGRPTSLAKALRKTFPLLTNRGSLIVVSDFFDDLTAIFEALNPYLHGGFKVHLFQILTPEELDLPRRGLTAFKDMENGERVVTHTDNIAVAYREAMQQHIAGLRSLCARRGISFALARTDETFYHLFDDLTQ